MLKYSSEGATRKTLSTFNMYWLPGSLPNTAQANIFIGVKHWTMAFSLAAWVGSIDP